LDNGAVTRGKLGASGCTNGQILKYGGNGWACSADTDTNTTYSAGSGLARSGTTFSIASSGVTATHLASNSVGASEMLDNAIGLAEMQNDSVGAAELRSNSVGAAEMVDGAIGAAELADGAVSNAAVSNAAAIAGHKIKFADETYVPGTGTAAENGTALRNAFNAINATLTNRKTLRIGPGDFDLGASILYVDEGLNVIGSGRRATNLSGARPGSYVVRTKKGSAMRHLSITNTDIDSVGWSKVIFNSSTSNGDVHSGEAFTLDNVYLWLNGNQNANNMLIDNRGTIHVDNSFLKNYTGGTGYSMGLYSNGVGSYARVSNSFILVDNAGGSTGEKFNVWASTNTNVDVLSSRIVQTASNSGDGRALYATSDSIIYVYSSATHGKTYSAYETSGGDVTFYGGRMSDNEYGSVTCTGMRAWSGNGGLSGSCD
jgi:hypothetical protein